MDTIARPRGHSRFHARLFQSRAKRGFDFYLSKQDTILFDHMLRVEGFGGVTEKIFKQCRNGLKLYGEPAIREAIEGVLHQLLLRKAIKSPRVNLTSEARYDAVYHLLTVLGEYYPKYADRIQRKRVKLEQIRGRYDDNYRYRSARDSSRRAINSRR
jgi:hypothetical protein